MRWVVVDASFAREADREAFLAPAALGRAGSLLVCRANPNPSVVLARLAGRRHDASDPDEAVYREPAGRREEAGPLPRPATREIAADGSPESVLAREIEAIGEIGLAPGATPAAVGHDRRIDMGLADI